MENIFLQLLNMSITASCVIIVVVIIRLLLRKAPKKYSYLLWGVVGFRLCCPVSFASVISIFNASPIDMSTAQSADGVLLHYVPENIESMSQSPLTFGIPELNTVTGPSLPAAAPEINADPMQLLITIGTIAWCAGIIALIVYGIVSYTRIKHRMATAIRLSDNVFESDKVASPFILGFLKPRIYIPFGLNDDVLEYVLMHERYHIKRKDHIIKLISFFLLTIYWYNPFCWLAFVLMSRDMEMSCDEKALSGMIEDKKAYSMSLLSFASNRRFPNASPLAFGETGVKSRIKNALSFKKPKWSISIQSKLKRE